MWGSPIRRDVGIALPKNKYNLWQYSGNAGIETCSKPLDAATCMSEVFTCSEEVSQVLQWNPSKADTIGTRFFVRYSEVSIAQG